MLYKINNIYGKVIFSRKTSSLKLCVKYAAQHAIDLSGADLPGADLSGVDLAGVDLSGADLSRADLSGSDLPGANLSIANISGANLSGANLSGANLSRANISGANFSGANLDFSSGITFRCSSFDFKADLRLAAQLAYHFCRIDFTGCDDAVMAQKSLKKLANKFHRVDECGRI